MLPGNHDAVRPAEPQPTSKKTFSKITTPPPLLVIPRSARYVRLLSYHGKSIDDFVAGLKTVTYADPVEAIEMLRRRHLAPQWGGKTPLSPELRGRTRYTRVLDIFVTIVRSRMP